MTERFPNPPSKNLTDEDKELEMLGITRVPADFFDWNGFRYSHARDAIAAAKRVAGK